MSLLTQAVSLLSGRKDAVIDWPRGWNEFLGGQVSTDAGVSVGPEDAMKVSAFYACIRLIAYTVASFPVDVYRNEPAGGKVPATDPPRWIRRPNAEQLWPEFCAQMVASLASQGDLFLDTRNKDSRGYPTDLFVLAPRAVVLARQNGNNSLSYTLNTTTGPEPVERRNIVHVRALTMPGSDRGLAPLDVARQELGIAIASQRYLATYYANGATVSAVLQFPPGVSQPEAAQYVADFRELYAGSGNAHKVAGLVAAEYKPMAVTNEQSQFLQLRSFSVVDIARIFGVPPHRVGEMLDKPQFGNNLEQQNLTFLQDAVQPYVSLLESAFFELMPRPYYLKFNTNALLRADSTARAALYQALFSMGALTPDEIRGKEELNPLSEGRGAQTYVMTNLGPVGPSGRPQVPQPGA